MIMGVVNWCECVGVGLGGRVGAGFGQNQISILQI